MQSTENKNLVLLHLNAVAALFQIAEVCAFVDARSISALMKMKK